MNQTAIRLFMMIQCLSGCAQESRDTDYLNYANSGVKITTNTIESNGIKLSISGGGIYIGNNIVLTAAHVVKEADVGGYVNVALDGAIGTGSIIAKKISFSPGDSDIAAIQLSLGMEIQGSLTPRLPLCSKIYPKEDEQLLVQFRSVYRIPHERESGPEEHPSIPGSYEPGTSGAGIVDAKQHCLEGIVSFSDNILESSGNYFPNTAIGLGSGHLYFTPSSTIRRILEEWHLKYDISP